MYSVANLERTYGCRVTSNREVIPPYIVANVKGPPFCYKLDFKVISPHHIIFLYHYNRPKEDTKIQFVFWCYKKVGDKFTECCYLSDGKKIIDEELSSEDDLATSALAKFKNVLDRHRDTVEDLYLDNVSTLSTEPIDFGTAKLPKLRNMIFVDTKGFEQVVSILPDTLKKFTIHGAQLNPSILECKEFYTIAEVLEAPDLEMNWTQLEMLTATDISMKIGELGEEDVCQMVLNWREDARVKFFQFDLTGTEFNFDILCRLLDIPYNECLNHDFYHPKFFARGATLDIVTTKQGARLLQFEEFDDLML